MFTDKNEDIANNKKEIKLNLKKKIRKRRRQPQNYQSHYKSSNKYHMEKNHMKFSLLNEDVDTCDKIIIFFFVIKEGLLNFYILERVAIETVERMVFFFYCLH